MPSTGPNAEGARKRSLPFKAPSRVDNNASRTSSAPSKAVPKTQKSTTTAKKPTKAKLANTKTSTTSRAKAVKPAPKPVEIISSDSSSSSDDEEAGSPPPPAKKRRNAREADADELDDDEEDTSDAVETAPTAPARPAASKPQPMDPGPAIPQKLLTRLLYEGFEDKKMKIGTEAMSVVGKYVETFVREALARAVYEREEGDEALGKGTGDGFLQVEDLEKLAPQLLMDF